MTNPSPEIPSSVAYLGAALELIVKPPRGREIVYSWEAESPLRHALCAAGDAKSVYIFRTNQPKMIHTTGFPTDTKALWRAWSGFTVDGALSFNIGASAANLVIGRAKSIAYRSDKWTGEDLDYEHQFGPGILVWVDRRENPRAIIISAAQPRRIVTARGIVG